MISKKLKLLREKNNLTQQQVADKLKINRSTYSYYELGKIRPNIDTIIKLSKIFDVHYTEILENEDLDVVSDQNINNFFKNDKKIISKIHDINELNLNQKEKKLITNFRQLPKKFQNYFFNIINEFNKSENTNK